MRILDINRGMVSIDTWQPYCWAVGYNTPHGKFMMLSIFLGKEEAGRCALKARKTNPGYAYFAQPVLGFKDRLEKACYHEYAY